MKSTVDFISMVLLSSVLGILIAFLELPIWLAFLGGAFIGGLYALPDSEPTDHNSD